MPEQEGAPAATATTTTTTTAEVFSLALEQSYGFFDKIPDSTWRLQSELASKAAKRRPHGYRGPNAGNWYLYHAYPDFLVPTMYEWEEWETDPNGSATHRGLRK